MRDVLLVRYGEVFLKGANRPHFLKVLTDNIKRAVKPIGGNVWLTHSVPPGVTVTCTGARPEKDGRCAAPAPKQHDDEKV